jgi:hypothetical protein
LFLLSSPERVPKNDNKAHCTPSINLLYLLTLKLGIRFPRRFRGSRRGDSRCRCPLRGAGGCFCALIAGAFLSLRFLFQNGTYWRRLSVIPDGGGKADDAGQKDHHESQAFVREHIQ